MSIIRKMRIERGWSQEQLAAISGVNCRTIQRIEAGRTPSVETLKSLGAAFDVHFLELKEKEMDHRSNSQQYAALIEAAETNMEKGLRAHIVVYLLVNVGLAAINMWATPGHLWLPFTTLFWGIGLVVHRHNVGRKRGWLAEFRKP